MSPRPHGEERDRADIPDPFAGEAHAPLPLLPPLPPSPPRSRVLAHRWGALALALVLEALVIVGLGIRALPIQTIVLGVLLPLSVSAAAVTFLVRASLPSARLAWAAGGAAALFFLATALEARGPAAPPASAVACMVVTSILLGIPFVLGALSLRHAFPTGARGRAASLGVAAGLVGAAAIRLHCAHDDALHVMLGHGLPMALAGLVGLAVHRVLRA